MVLEPLGSVTANYIVFTSTFGENVEKEWRKLPETDPQRYSREPFGDIKCVFMCFIFAFLSLLTYLLTYLLTFFLYFLTFFLYILSMCAMKIRLKLISAPLLSVPHPYGLP